MGVTLLRYYGNVSGVIHIYPEAAARVRYSKPDDREKILNTPIYIGKLERGTAGRYRAYGGKKYPIGAIEIDKCFLVKGGVNLDTVFLHELAHCIAWVEERQLHHGSFWQHLMSVMEAPEISEVIKVRSPWWHWKRIFRAARIA